MQRHGQRRAEERVAQIRPQRPLGDGVELRQAVIDQKQLDQQRCATKEEDVGVRQRPNIGVTRSAGDAQRNGEDKAGNHRDGDQLQRDGGAVQQFRQPFENELPTHDALLAKPTEARFSSHASPIIDSAVMHRYISAATI